MNLAHELTTLERLTVADLRARYTALFGEQTRAGNKVWLVKRIAWRLQALAEGDLSERARRRARELAHDAGLRLSSPRPAKTPALLGADARSAKFPFRPSHRLPPPGTILHRPYKGQVVQVKVLERGFAFGGTIYQSLSAVAKAITGSHCNGYLFFRLTPKGAAS
jgi:hypothetical protein